MIAGGGRGKVRFGNHEGTEGTKEEGGRRKEEEGRMLDALGPWLVQWPAICPLSWGVFPVATVCPTPDPFANGGVLSSGRYLLRMTRIG
jgi:hypothetical protein